MRAACIGENCNSWQVLETDRVAEMLLSGMNGFDLHTSQENLLSGYLEIGDS